MEKPGPIVTKVIDKRIVEANCSICDDPLDLGNDVGSQEQQMTKMWTAFNRHLKATHPQDK